MAAPGFTSADNVNHAQGISIKGGGIIPLTAHKAEGGSR